MGRAAVDTLHPSNVARVSVTNPALLPWTTSYDPDGVMELVKWSDDSDDHADAGQRGDGPSNERLVIPADVPSGAGDDGSRDTQVAGSSPDEVYTMVMG